MISGQLHVNLVFDGRLRLLLSREPIALQAHCNLAAEGHAHLVPRALSLRPEQRVGPVHRDRDLATDPREFAGVTPDRLVLKGRLGRDHVPTRFVARLHATSATAIARSSAPACSWLMS